MSACAYKDKEICIFWLVQEGALQHCVYWRSFVNYTVLWRYNIRNTRNLIDSLGLTIRPDKSITIPTLDIQHLGYILNSHEMTVQVTCEKVLEIKELRKKNIRLEYVSIRKIGEYSKNGS